ncbi:cytochrome c oxidase assembly protein [Nibricoccus sp. IMCC34717]|uniref:cytochrome c oxidase assembly protein n=1 Tax=Nibricoccus sp. IMCC34717 TaxID=3034021 RepID=UPI00384E6804
MIDWTHWHNEPWLIGGLVVLGWLYHLLTGPLRSSLAPGVSRSRTQTAAFYAGLVIFYLAVGSPLDQIGERFLLSAHMIQHQLLVYGAAICFWVGTPAWLVDRWFGSHPPRVIRALAHPICCGMVYTLTLSLWHAPDLYDLALRDKNVHVLEHLMFFGAALFFWAPLLSPSRLFPSLRPPVQILYVAAVTIGMTPVFAFIAFSENVLYPTYEYAPRIIASLSSQEDQLLGAAIMKIGGLMIMLIVAGVAFYRWSLRDRLAAGNDASA